MSTPPIKQKYISSPEELETLWNEYKETIDNSPDEQEISTAQGIKIIRVRRPYQRKGFEAYVWRKKGHHVKQYIENTGDAYDSYLGVVTHMRNEWEEDQIEGSLTGRYKSATLVARLNGYVDKKEVKEQSDVTISFK